MRVFVEVTGTRGVELFGERLSGCGCAVHDCLCCFWKGGDDDNYH